MRVDDRDETAAPIVVAGRPWSGTTGRACRSRRSACAGKALHDRGGLPGGAEHVVRSQAHPEHVSEALEHGRPGRGRGGHVFEQPTELRSRRSSTQISRRFATRSCRSRDRKKSPCSEAGRVLFRVRAPVGRHCRPTPPDAAATHTLCGGSAPRYSRASRAMPGPLHLSTPPLQQQESGSFRHLAQSSRRARTRGAHTGGTHTTLRAIQTDGKQFLVRACVPRDLQRSGGAARAPERSPQVWKLDSRVRAAAVVARTSVPAGAAVLSAHATSSTCVGSRPRPPTPTATRARSRSIFALLRGCAPRRTARRARRRQAVFNRRAAAAVDELASVQDAAALDGLAAVAKINPAALVEQPAACGGRRAARRRAPRGAVAALRALGRTGASTLGAHAAAVVRRLRAGEPAVCEAAVCARAAR